MKKIKKAISLFLTLVLLCLFSYSAFATETTSLYEINASDTSWKEFTSHEEMIEAISVSKSYLEECSTSDLLLFIVNYPLIGDIFAYDTTKEGINHVKTYCSSLDLFFDRKDANKALQDVLLKNTTQKLSSQKYLQDISLYVVEALYDYMLQTNNNRDSYATVYTPNGTAVSVINVTSDFSSSTKTSINNYFISAYPNAQFVSTSTQKYNCHSFAWYSSSTSNHFWMNNPSAYMSDGSYTQTSSCLNATKLFYTNGGHSARVYDAISNSLSTTTVKSKWGNGPLMIHKALYCPYNSTGITKWH